MATSVQRFSFAKATRDRRRRWARWVGDRAATLAVTIWSYSTDRDLRYFMTIRAKRIQNLREQVETVPA